MVYWYNSTSYRDDLTWASAWLYKATGDAGYLSDAYAFWTEHSNQEGIYDLRYLVRDKIKKRLVQPHLDTSLLQQLLSCPPLAPTGFSP